MVAEVKSLQRKELTEKQQDVLDCITEAKNMDYDFVFIYGMKDGLEYLHHNGFETLEMIGRLEGLKYQIWQESQG